MANRTAPLYVQPIRAGICSNQRVGYLGDRIYALVLDASEPAAVLNALLIAHPFNSN